MWELVAAVVLHCSCKASIVFYEGERDPVNM